MPQPDILLLVDDPVRYEREHPRVADAFLAIEVGDSSRIADRTVKEPLYARAGIAEAWFVDIVEREIRVVRRPRNGAFTTVLSFGRGDELACAAFPDDRFQVDDLLGPRAAD